VVTVQALAGLKLLLTPEAAGEESEEHGDADEDSGKFFFLISREFDISAASLIVALFADKMK
jgi:hypothetical protein